MIETLFYIGLTGATLVFAAIVILPVFFGAPWHPTSLRRVRQILDFAGVEPGQKIYDLGSGDGRVLIIAARQYGMTGVGLEIDPIKAWISRHVVKFFGVQDRVQIVRRSFFDYDFSDADVLFIYLSHQALDRLLPAMRERLKPEVKIICYGFCLRSLEPTKVNADKTIFVYQLHKGTRLNAYS